MEETNSRYYFNTRCEALLFQDKNGGEIEQNILPSYMGTETVYFINKNTIEDKKEIGKMNIDKVIEIAEDLGWNVLDNNVDRQNSKHDTDYELQKYSPKDYDFHMYVQNVKDGKSFVEEIYRNIEYFDPSEETALWLDDEGHGRNGAPHNIKDLYDDMIACQDMMYELYNQLVAEINKK